MPRILPALAVAVAAATAVSVGGGVLAAAHESLDAERRAELEYMVRHDCGSCHGMSLEGGLGLPLLPERLADIPDEALVVTILDGRPGTPMPPWRALLSEAEAEWIVDYLKGERE